MAKNKSKIKTIGMFSIRESVEKMIATANNLLIGLRYAEGSDEEVKNVKLKTVSGLEAEIPATAIIQAAEAIKSVDRTKRFVCGYHGPFVSPKSSSQPATCPGCMGGIMLDLRGRQAVIEDADA